MALTTELDASPQTAPATRQWIEDPSQLPWFDQPDALDRVPEVANRWNLGDDSHSLLTKWVRDGYVVLRDLLPPETIQTFSSRIDDVWFRTTPIPGLWICDVIVDGVMRVAFPHDELLALPLDVRIRAKADSNWRIAGYHQYESAAAALFDSPEIQNVCSALFDRPAIPRYSLTFSKGSQQALHQDISAFHVWPRNYLIGAWVACEDITEDAGPLVYHPGSHRSPMFPGFDNYPQTQQRTAPQGQLQQYTDFVYACAADHKRELFLAKQGEILFWHGMLIHGGAPTRDPAATRKSFVLHYMPDGVDRSADIAGPFNW